MNLNPEQLRAVNIDAGPAVVFAGAGSGKTRIITERICRLVRSGVPPRQILALTFTNKATREMLERVEARGVHGAHIATFHAACARWLREFADHLGFTSNFLILDESDSQSLMRRVMKDLFGPEAKSHNVADYKHAVHRLKTHGIYNFEAESIAQFIPRAPFGLKEFYDRYQTALQASDAMDFGDLLMNSILLFRRDQNFLAALQNRYRFVLVDEFQDTNAPQQELLRFLCEKHKNLFVVGDDDQAIYSWRGASPALLIDFEKHFPGAQKVVLRQNYRSCSNIVDAARALIEHNRQRVGKETFSDIPLGQMIRVVGESDQHMEAWHVAEQIKSELKEFSYEDFAVFYRTNSQSRSIEEVFNQEQIPYRIYGALRFFERQEVKDVVAYLRLICNPNDDVSFLRVVNLPARGLGEKSINLLAVEAKNRQCSFHQCLLHHESLAAKFAPFLNVLNQLKSSPPEDLWEWVPLILKETRYEEYLLKKFPDEDRIGNIHELTSALQEFVRRGGTSLSEWLNAVSLDGTSDNDFPGVSLMTLHTAKGLEFKRVFILGAEEGLSPHKSALNEPWGLEEERRLFYVGMTRARERLSLIYVDRRLLNGQTLVQSPSRFISEIPEKFLSYTSATGLRTQKNLFIERDSSEAYGVGEKVFHPTYGEGRVFELSDPLGTTKIVVDFAEFGKRRVAISHLYR